MSYKIPLFDLNFGIEEEKAVSETLRSKWISSGPKCLEFEKVFSEHLGADYAVSLTNCTCALHLSLIALGIESDAEVIVPSLTFVATVNAVRYVNAKPVFCDILSCESLNMDPDHIETLITEKTKAIIPMHYAGFPCDMEKIMSIAKKNNLSVIEDACHGPLSEYKGKKLGTIGDIGCFSFFSNKNISTGEGGMIVTNNKAVFERIKNLRSHGMTTVSYDRAKGHATSYDITDLGYNYRMDDIRASLGLTQIKKLLPDLKRRAEIRDLYISELKSIEEIIIPFEKNTGFVSNYIFPIVLKDSNAIKRDRLRNILKDRFIQTSIHYPPVHLFSIYGYKNGSLPVTENVGDNEITLPMYGNLSDENVHYITESIKKGLL